ncbi:MAG: tRNA (guanosine(46)-N7)-methyltransferase TrmB [Methylococcaceae bacterium]|jgi:tRNA (guanine-N7-)-methyltransferase|nr:tRNA (guanosine(46)-N7)-methyltransferase TrmB [Methylococcaceae bacterium]MDZ4154942.1 tRNA (guanosine(46)-N7)-methyltransferase TrmB [Methylococcales bacterium]MDP2392431.1 tRNA (guanosine(46)-N7)-methyltransferase TrmB [Methylococcaceae bacterium]MDP3019537.1 tRNA (guanosine(46)-N7)-methyltransferase TrmB [Methylococcaceae bacterium]MDP3389253.1 tRNA (guanosine(46)-N7)-methyltransferase TrmB [Methylococcaceae bacterium]
MSSEITTPATTPARIRSFIRRQGRLTQGQQYALSHHWDKYCLDPQVAYDFAEVFGRVAPIIMEIGFGNGESLAKMAADNPDTDYIGIEVHRPGVGHLMMLLDQQGLTNVRIYCHDAIDILEHKLPDASLAGVHLFFPDPWPKKKHHKRRIVRPSFIALLLKKLKVGGYFHAATDWENYAESMLEVLSADPGLLNSSETGDYCPRPEYRPLTKFEQRGLRLGHGVWDLIFTKR